MAQDQTYLRQFFEGIRDERGTHQNTATRIGTAFLLLLDYLAATDYPYLRRDVADTAAGRITFLEGLTAHLQSLFEGLTFEDVLRSEGASDGFDGSGITMTASDGRIQTDALEVRGWMRVAKLVYNMIQVMEQDYQFSGGGDIERVVDNHDGTYTLHIHKEKEGRHTSFGDFDILYGKTDDDAVSGTSFEYYTSWMRVCEGGVTLNEGMTPDTVRVELWDDDRVPGGKNFPPKAMMTAARRGNTRDTERQAFWELSTTDHRITHYWHVDQPILRADNYALCLGQLPEILDQAGVLPPTRDPQMPSLYVNTIFYENAHHIYYPSRVVKVDRGEWTASPTAQYTGPDGTYTPDGTLADDALQAAVAEGDITERQAAEARTVRTWGGTYTQGQTVGEPYHFETFSRVVWLTHRLSPANTRLTDLLLLRKMRYEWHVDLETSRTWHYGALWECLADGTAEEPGISPHWTMISGQALRLDFRFSRGTMVWVDDVHLLVEARLLIASADVTDDILVKVADGLIDASWTWERMSNEDGTKTAADAAWQPVTLPDSPNILDIDHRLGDASRRQDCGPLWESQMRVWYRCTARLSTGQTAEAELGLG